MLKIRFSARKVVSLCLAGAIVLALALAVLTSYYVDFGIHDERLMTGLALLTVAGMLGLALLHNRLIVQPMQGLARAIAQARHLTGHADTELAQPLPVAELEAIRRAVLEYRLQLRDLHSVLRNQNRTLHDRARLDALTGCHNRRAYDEEWGQYCALRATTPGATAFLLFDCDRFRAVNDSYGHAVADRVLALIADALTVALRAGDPLYRLGSDEFVAYIPDATELQARRIAQRCLELVDAIDFGRLGIHEPVSLSIGIACAAADSGDELGDLPRRADIAMYAAKQPSHPRVAVFGDADADAAGSARVASRETTALFQALSEPGHIEMHYQALFKLPERRLDCYEALARIRHGDELLSPAAFLPIVASRRLETEFDAAVLAQIDIDLESGHIPAGCGVSLNLSAQSLSQASIVGLLLAMARHLARHALTLEITETSLITQIAEVRRDLDRLREVGYRVAMDDFGTGFSPVRYLLDLPVDTVKFDISLIRKLADGGRGGEIVAGLARLMSEAGYPLVAEGIETHADLVRAEALGFTLAQGFLLGRPSPFPLQTAARPESAEPGIPVNVYPIARSKK